MSFVLLSTVLLVRGVAVWRAVLGPRWYVRGVDSQVLSQARGFLGDGSGLFQTPDLASEVPQSEVVDVIQHFGIRNELFLEATIGVFAGDFVDFAHRHDFRAGAQAVQQVAVVTLIQEALEYEDAKLVPHRVAMASACFVAFLQLLDDLVRVPQEQVDDEFIEPVTALGACRVGVFCITILPGHLGAQFPGGFGSRWRFQLRRLLVY